MDKVDEVFEMEVKWIRFLRKLKKAADRDWGPDIRECINDFIEKEKIYLYDPKYDKRRKS